MAALGSYYVCVLSAGSRHSRRAETGEMKASSTLDS